MIKYAPHLSAAFAILASFILAWPEISNLKHARWRDFLNHRPQNLGSDRHSQAALDEIENELTIAETPTFRQKRRRVAWGFGSLAVAAILLVVTLIDI